MSPHCPIRSDNFGALQKGSGVRELQIQAPSLEGALKPFLYFIYHGVVTSELLNIPCKVPAPVTGGAAHPDQALAAEQPQKAATLPRPAVLS